MNNNSIFNVKRFIDVLIRDFVAFKGLYIGVMCGVLGFFLYFAIQDYSFGKGLGSGVLVAANVLIIISPIMATIRKRDAVINTLLPASSFEKYLSQLIAYVVIIPLVVYITVYALSCCMGLLVETSEQFREGLSLSSLFNPYYYLMTIMFQSVFVLGCLSFKRYAGIKTFLIIMVVFLLYRGVAYSLVPDLLDQDKMDVYRYSMARVEEMIMISECPEAKPAMLVLTMVTIIKLIFPLGLWYVGYLKLKEKEV